MTSITIVGGGIFGLACGWELARRGAGVRVIEAERIGAGSSGNPVGALAPHVPDSWNAKKAFQLDSLLRAESFWAEVSQVANLPSGYARTGRLQPIEDEAALAKLATRVSAGETQWPQGIGMRITISPQSPLLPESPTGAWLQDNMTARINPREALPALAEAIRQKGGEVIEGQAANPGEMDGTVLWACGAGGLAALGSDLGRKIGDGVKGQAALLGFSAPDAPQVFGNSLLIVPHANGTTGIGSTSENDYDHVDPDEKLDDIVTRARALCPALADAPVLARWAGLRPRATTRSPLLGAWPGRSGHFVANGAFKIGYGMAPKVAQVMADLILEGEDQIPDGFRLS